MPVYHDKLFKNPAAVIKAFNSREFVQAFDMIEKYRKTHCLLGYIRYEAKDVFAGREVNSSLPLLYFEVFKEFEKYVPSHSSRFSLNPVPSPDFERYSKAIERIKEEIACGNTYEVNYTFDFDVSLNSSNSGCSDSELYAYLLGKQKTPYNMFMKNEYETVLSFSPELFFEVENNHIVTQPMKGTAAADKNADDFLKNDVKNRAENVMIVDLLRNDLGRIAKTGSVKVTKLFEIETHPTFHTMISRIEADLPEGIKLFDIFKAIFPCGSVTGAPKISTMKIIDEVEQGSRGIYCGAIGFLSPEKATFSVPIRILQRAAGVPPESCCAGGTSRAEHCKNVGFRYRVGGAVVWDSNARDEWIEAFTKTKFLNDDFKLVETVKIDSGDLAEHLDRMENSAHYYGFPFDKPAVLNMAGSFGSGIIRILLDKEGRFEVERKELEKCTPDRVRLSALSVNSRDEFLYHKTTYRPYYNVDYSRFYDEIFCNEKGELTEGSRTNIVLEIDGEFYTPPVECGLLNGIYRQKLLNEGKCTEKILYKEDLYKAQGIYCVNSVRGMKKAAYDFN
ncbi:MAG: chorismate-binding protein [Heliobacteriaceae bacterium]|jgi:para-aminobenzoate synthetase/4-amino-4-deoxychorismate lyase|nr:chorismate-binding protein [Heliobacteriaceae bacterium]